MPVTGQGGLIDTEILVVGGGPAGAVCATSLARLRHNVILCEAVSFPRDHIGVCLSPGVFSQFDFLGLGHLLRCAPHRAFPMKMRWGTEVFIDAPRDAFIVDRGRLDFDLLAAAANSGVCVLQPARVRGIAREGNLWIAEACGSSGPLRIRSAFVVDARGRSSPGHRKPFGSSTIAIYGEWTGDFDQVVRLAASEASWSWIAPVHSGRFIAIAFTSPRALRGMKGSLEERYCGLLRDAGILHGRSALLSGPRVCDATPYLKDDAGNGFLRVGDADVALDPFSSCGVQAAVQSGLCAAPVINTLLNSEADGEAALEYWATRRRERVRSHGQWSSERYREASKGCQTEFWQTRALLDESASWPPETTPLPRPEQILTLSGQVSFVDAACLQGQLVVRRRCLLHPSLAEPIAYVDGILLEPMLRILAEAQPASQVIAAWTSVCPPARAISLLAWLWRHRIAVAR